MNQFLHSVSIDLFTSTLTDRTKLINNVSVYSFKVRHLEYYNKYSKNGKTRA